MTVASSAPAVPLRGRKRPESIDQPLSNHLSELHMPAVSPAPFTRLTRGFGLAAGASLVLALLALVPAAAAAQDGARLVTVTRVESPAMMSGMGGGAQQAPDTTVTLVKGLKRRMDTGSSSTIVDLTDGSVIALDHEARTWWRFDLAAMQAQVDSAMTEMSSQLEVSGDVDVNPTGETMDMDGRAARRVVVTLTMDMQPQADLSGGYNPMAAMGGMGMAVVNDMWVSDDLPTAQQSAAAGDVDVEELMGGRMALPFPGMDAAVEQMKEELEEIGGEALVTRTYMAMLPGGAALDPEAVLALNDQPLPDPDMSALMGGGGGEPVIMSRTIAEVVQVETGLSIDDSRFAPPADYMETEAPSLPRMQGPGGD